MNKEELFKIIGEIDEHKVAAAGMAMKTKKRSRPIWIKWSVMAACLCIVTLLGVETWRTGTTPEHAITDAGINNDQQLVDDSSDDNSQESIKKQDNNKELISDKLNEVGENDSFDSDTTNSYTDAPVQGELGNTGALNPYEKVWGGSYIDQNGYWVIWLTENTPENQKMVFEINSELLESNTIFKTADYSLAYLTELMAKISKEMVNGRLPYVTVASLKEQVNRVEVTMTTDDADSVTKVLSFDKIGGAIEIQYASEFIKNEVIVKEPAR